MDTTTLLIVLSVALVAFFLIKKKGGDAPAESATDAGDSQEPEAQQDAPAGEEAGELQADVHDAPDEDAPLAVEEVAPSAFDAGSVEESAPSEMATPSDEAAPAEEEAPSPEFGAEDAGGDGSTEDDQQDTPSRDGDPYA